MEANLSMVCMGLASGIALLLGGYFALRYYLLKNALREAGGELREICGDLEQNRILRLPVPDGALGALMESVNLLLEEVRRERLGLLRREREFQEQIENISHDLRTPLTVILGYLKLLRKSPEAWREKDDPKWRETLEIMERNGRTMEKLVAQFYAYSQVSGAGYEMELGEVDVCRALREALAENYGLLEKLSLRVKLPEHPVKVRGNGEALERIFQNLLQNAGRYARSFLHVSMEGPSEAQPQVRIMLANDGEGVTEAEAACIFDRFYRGDRARGKGGSGLGLAIAKSLAEGMGGSLTARVAGEEPDPEAKETGGGKEGILEDEGVLCFTLTLSSRN